MSNLQITGTIKSIGEVQTGIAKSSGKEWKKMLFVIDTEGEYPKSVAFNLFGGEKVDNFVKYNKVGQRVDVSFDVESREYKGKYYSEFNAWKVFSHKEAATTANSVPSTTTVEDAGNLPF